MTKQGKIVPLMGFACMVLVFSGCLTPKKLDRFVAEQYYNELPKPGKKKKAGIEVATPASDGNSRISTTVRKMDKFLPLLVYWEIDQRLACSLNPSIPVTNFSNAINSLASDALITKLNGKKLELTVEQAPSVFSLVTEENIVWVIFVLTWAKVYIEPDKKDLVVAYKLEDGQEAKTGKITVKSVGKNKGFRFFQSWKSAISEYLTEYNTGFTTMTRDFVNQLAKEL